MEPGNLLLKEQARWHLVLTARENRENRTTQWTDTRAHQGGMAYRGAGKILGSNTL